MWDPWLPGFSVGYLPVSWQKVIALQAYSYDA
jgi:hypothetical protein